MPQIAGIDEEDFIDSIAEFAIGFTAAQEPQAGRYLRIQKQLGGKVDDAIHQACFDQCLSDISLAGCPGGQGTLCQDKPGLATGAQVIEEVLYPGIVGISCGRCAVFPSSVLADKITAPVALIEGRVGYHIIGFQVLVCVI